MSSPEPTPGSRGRSRTPTKRATPDVMDTDRPNGARSRTRSRSRSPSRARSLSRSRSRSYSRSRSPTKSRSRSPPLPSSAKIVIEKLTKNIHEAHLHEIFSTYGTIDSLQMPTNPQFMMNKGIAYILYTSPAYAEAAIAHMHEAQLDGVQVNVSIVLPRRRWERSPPGMRGREDRFGEPRRLRGPPPMSRGGYGGPPPMSRGGDRAYGGGPPRRPSPVYGGRDFSPPPRSYRGGSPPSRYGGPPRGGGGGGYRDRYDERDRYRPRSLSRSPPPRRRRSPSYGSRSRSPSRTPPRRRGGNSPPRGGRRRRSPSYDSFSSRSRSRDRRPARR